MASSMEQWLSALNQESWDQWDAIQSEPLDDSFGWGAMLGLLANRMDRQSGLTKERRALGNGLLITGPQGCGRHTAAAHMMALMQEREYDVVFLSGATLADLSWPDGKKLLDALIKKHLDDEEAMCIQLEDLEDWAPRGKFLTYLGRRLQEFRTKEYSGKDGQQREYPGLFLILIDSQEQTVPAILRSQLLLCRMALPDLDQRLALLKSHGAGVENVLSLECFARSTQGATYSQLLDMLATVTWLIDSQDLDYLEDKQLKQFLAGQMPVPEHTQAAAPGVVQAAPVQTVAAAPAAQNVWPEEMGDIARALAELVRTVPKVAKQNADSRTEVSRQIQDLTRSFQELVTQLPDLLQSLPRTGVSNVPVSQPNPALADQDGYQDSKRKEFEEMPPRELAVDLFGEERVLRLQKQHSHTQQQEQQTLAN